MLFQTKIYNCCKKMRKQIFYQKPLFFILPPWTAALPNFPFPNANSSPSHSGIITIAIIVLLVLVLGAICAIYWRKKRRQRRRAPADSSEVHTY